MADLDTKAADQFQPVHRSGHGAITFEGREYTRLAWIERTARNGGTLAAGEGAVLCAELDRLRGIIGRVRAECYTSYGTLCETAWVENILAALEGEG
jgi:hypothetical protein